MDSSLPHSSGPLTTLKNILLERKLNEETLDDTHSSNIIRIRAAQIRAKKLYQAKIRKIGVKIMDCPLYIVQTVIMQYL